LVGFSVFKTKLAIPNKDNLDFLFDGATLMDNHPLVA
jgi:hypothetical protein